MDEGKGSNATLGTDSLAVTAISTVRAVALGLIHA